MKKLKFDKKFILIALIGFLLVVTLFTKYYGSTDLSDYSDTARYFAGDYSADIRSSHSYLYGYLVHFFLIFDSYFIFKIFSIILIALIVISVYFISGKEKNAFWLIAFAPTVWYMAPWINPIQISSLFLLWSWYFIEKYSHDDKIKNLAFAGIFLGLSFAFWDTILFFGSFLIIWFMFDKKLSHLFFLLFFILIGLLPRLILDYSLFGFPFFSILKSFFGTLSNAFLFGRGSSYTSGIWTNFITFFLIFISIPFLFWRSYKKDSFFDNKKTLGFLSVCLILIFINPQIRYTLAIIPIIIVLISRNLNEIQFKKQLTTFILISFIFIIPTILQIFFSFNQTNYADITSVLTEKNSYTLTNSFEPDLIKTDLNQITKDYPSEELYLVLGIPDYYQKLAHIYWGDKIKEFVSIQDYSMYYLNLTDIFSKKLIFLPKINERRYIWIGGGIGKNPNDLTNYSEIDYALSFKEENLTDVPKGFEKIKDYSILSVWNKN
ncbi:hypothetical protein J4477_03245 [Candidatus Pacearchaeota archaeon]|nr:hypothetical protein [Candidatus Pacearchaeota archaeon]